MNVDPHPTTTNHPIYFYILSIQIFIHFLQFFLKKLWFEMLENIFLLSVTKFQIN